MTLEDLANFVSLPAITAISYYAAEVYKWFISDSNGQIHNTKERKFIPILCATVGLTIGVVSFLISPKIVHADNLLTAAAVGLTSGFASVGIHQSRKNSNAKRQSE